MKFLTYEPYYLEEYPVPRLIVINRALKMAMDSTEAWYFENTPSHVVRFRSGLRIHLNGRNLMVLLIPVHPPEGEIQ